MNKLVSSTIVGFLALSPLMNAEATVVSAGGGSWAVRSDTATGSATWRFFNPTAADTITWTSGINHTDGVAHAQNVFGPEAKFTTVPALAGRAYAGFADKDGPGPLGSTTQTTGTGNGALVPGTLWGTNAVSNWTITATGKKGIAGGAKKGFPRWDSTATANDPLNIFQSQVEAIGISTTHYDQFFALGLSAGLIPQASNGTILGEIGLNAAYEDTAGVVDILDILIDANGVSVSGSQDAKFYRLSSLSEGPTELVSSLISLSDIKDMLNADFASDFSLDSPLYLGIVMEDLLLPTSTLANGALAQIHINSRAYDADVSVPEPNSGLLMISGLIGLSCVRRRKLCH